MNRTSGGRSAKSSTGRDPFRAKETNVGGGTSSRSKDANTSSNDGPAGGWASALKMAKERAELSEKRAEMAVSRAGDLERSLRDSVLHVEWLESELANSRRRGGGGGGASDSSSSSVSELTERLRRVELAAEKRNHALA